MKVDVAINVYGKPFETAVTLLSLLKYSGKHINKIYFALEAKQPRWREHQFVTELLPDKLIQFVPKYWLWLDAVDKNSLNDEQYRHSIRYQYAWEKTNSDFLYLTHNDVLYVGDIIGAMLENIGQNIAVGQVGQCWNCPAFSAKLCNGDSYWNYRPNLSEALDLHRKGPNLRGFNYERWINRAGAWPLPECRLNEWAALINMQKARPETIPIGEADPFGGMSIDIGTKWFQYVSRKGFRIKNFDISKFAIHGWTNEERSGHQSLFNKSRYDRSEKIARDHLSKEFGISPEKAIRLTAVMKISASQVQAQLRRALSSVKRRVSSATAKYLRGRR
jgi:hypothetical protein